MSSSDKIARSVHYYELLARKHGENPEGLGEHQARVHTELAELVSQCTSLAEIQERMRAQGYLEKPAQALLLDSLAAHRRAAEEHGPAFTEIVRLYAEHAAAVAENYQTAHAGGPEQQIARELNRIGNVVGALGDMFAAHLRARGTHPDDMAHTQALAQIRAGAATIQSNGESFDATVDDPYFRRHSPLSDAAYAAARDGIRSVLSAGDSSSPAPTPDAPCIETRVRAALEAVEPRVDELKQLGLELDRRSGRAVWLSVAPPDEPGPYLRESFYEEGPAEAEG